MKKVEIEVKLSIDGVAYFEHTSHIEASDPSDAVKKAIEAKKLIVNYELDVNDYELIRQSRI